jgi:hypothetical protein
MDIDDVAIPTEQHTSADTKGKAKDSLVKQRFEVKKVRYYIVATPLIPLVF